MESANEPDRQARSLTNRQTEILRFLRDTIQQRGCAPTVREIGREMKIKSPNGVLCHLKALERKGCIRREENRARAIQLTDVPGQIPHRPMLRELQASRPLESLLNAEYVDFGALFQSGHLLFRVRGNGWANQHLIDGDFLVMRKGPATVGLSVVAIVRPKEAIVTRVIRAGEDLRLLVSDSRSIAMQDAEILGIVAGVVRRC